MKEIGIYIHIPFCVSKCAYCDFYSLPERCQSAEMRTRYVKALVRQFDWAKKKYGEFAVSTVFIGGGTPTVLSAELLTELITALKSRFDLTRNTEFTVEANPKTFDKEKLTALLRCGVNRLSIGIQSANENELKAIGRIHTFEEAKAAFDLTRKSGFDNISVDLMYGLPYQTEASFLHSVSEVIKLSPEHISVYGLQLEEGTPLHKTQNTLPFPSEEESLSMFSKAIMLLAENGYRRYEISNFAKRGYESKHNLGYWSQKEYLGFGSGAYSFFDNARFSTKVDVAAFCECKDFDALITVDEVLTDEDKAKEFVMLSLRLTQGVDVKELFNRTHNAEFILNKCEPFIKNGYLKNENGRLFFTEKGFNISNTVLSEILF
jgi:oxygen-independent coproporphyrinogen-3 oxidase